MTGDERTAGATDARTGDDGSGATDPGSATNLAQLLGAAGAAGGAGGRGPCGAGGCSVLGTLKVSMQRGRRGKRRCATKGTYSSSCGGGTGGRTSGTTTTSSPTPTTTTARSGNGGGDWGSDGSRKCHRSAHAIVVVLHDLSAKFTPRTRHQTKDIRHPTRPSRYSR